MNRFYLWLNGVAAGLWGGACMTTDPYHPAPLWFCLFFLGLTVTIAGTTEITRRREMGEANSTASCRRMRP